MAASSSNDAEMLVEISTPTPSTTEHLVSYKSCYVKFATTPEMRLFLSPSSGRVLVPVGEVLKGCGLEVTYCDPYDIPNEMVRVVVESKKLDLMCLTLAGVERLIREKPKMLWLQTGLVPALKSHAQWPALVTSVSHLTIEGNQVKLFQLEDRSVIIAAGQLYRAACHYHRRDPAAFCDTYASPSERIRHSFGGGEPIMCLTAAGVERAIREHSQIRLHQADLRRAMAALPANVLKREDALATVAAAAVASELNSEEEEPSLTRLPDEFAMRTVRIGTVDVRFVRSLAGQVLVVARDAKHATGERGWESVRWCRHFRSPEERVAIQATGIHNRSWTMCLTKSGVERAIRENRLTAEILTHMEWKPERKREREEDDDDKPLASPPKKVRLPEGFRTRDQLEAHIASQTDSLMARATEAQRAVSTDGLFRVLLTEHDTLASITQFLTTMVSKEVGFRHLPNPSAPQELLFSL